MPTIQKQQPIRFIQDEDYQKFVSEQIDMLDIWERCKKFYIFNLEIHI